MTSSLPQSNSTLTLIAGASSTENYTHPAGTVVRKWEGEVDAYVQRKIVTGLNESGQLNRTMAITMVIPSDLEPPVDVLAGDTVEFTEWDPVRGEVRAYRAKVQTFSTPADLPSLPNYLKLALEKMQAAP